MFAHCSRQQQPCAGRDIGGYQPLTAIRGCWYPNACDFLPDALQLERCARTWLSFSYVMNRHCRRHFSRVHRLKASRRRRLAWYRQRNGWRIELWNETRATSDLLRWMAHFLRTHVGRYSFRAVRKRQHRPDREVCLGKFMCILQTFAGTVGWVHRYCIYCGWHRCSCFHSAYAICSACYCLTVSKTRSSWKRRRCSHHLSAFVWLRKVTIRNSSRCTYNFW